MSKLDYLRPAGLLHNPAFSQVVVASGSRSRPPASTLVGVTALALPEWLVEIEAVAVID